ncbi:hypothetical protein BKA65DRAFT_481459 [Rhexocercosporidium sp. MPI-PUGE-AT-0058]|nr:hypothetical protein BKA65DRAFT_481459 [Rhexocercosporidium sp. MPI-PUGE-AT-0058]
MPSSGHTDVDRKSPLRQYDRTTGLTRRLRQQDDRFNSPTPAPRPPSSLSTTNLYHIRNAQLPTARKSPRFTLRIRIRIRSFLTEKLLEIRMTSPSFLTGDASRGTRTRGPSPPKGHGGGSLTMLPVVKFFGVLSAELHVQNSNTELLSDSSVDFIQSLHVSFVPSVQSRHNTAPPEPTLARLGCRSPYSPPRENVNIRQTPLEREVR